MFRLWGNTTTQEKYAARIIKQCLSHEITLVMAILGIKEDIKSLKELLPAKKLSSNFSLKVSPPKAKRTPLVIKPQKIVPAIGQKEF